MIKRIFVDFEKCQGCKNCSAACMQAHRKDEGDIYTLDMTDVENEPRHAIVQDHNGRYLPMFCRHCDEPPCVLACTTGSLIKDEQTNHILYDETKCDSCFMCVMECSYGILKPDQKTKTKLVRCDFCMKDGEEDPNCVKMCPSGAIYVQEV